MQQKGKARKFSWLSSQPFLKPLGSQAKVVQGLNSRCRRLAISNKYVWNKNSKKKWEPWKKSPLGFLVAAAAIASHIMTSAPCSSVLSLSLNLAWKSGRDDLTPVQKKVLGETNATNRAINQLQNDMRLTNLKWSSSLKGEKTMVEMQIAI